ncbi:MAG: TIGR03663 family protein, partial [Ktedonobacteraceae bacterium]|nr:TIGR03663 family protein [Ktedonobacteraceae bacterium]
MKRYPEEPRELETITDEDLDLSILDNMDVAVVNKPEAGQPPAATVNHQPVVTAVDDLPESDAGDEGSERPRWTFRWPTREQLLLWLPFWVVILLGATLRFWGLGDKPLHHDESLHAYYSLQLMHDMEHWLDCFRGTRSCFRYDPLIHGPFQFHGIALVYKIAEWLNAPDHGVNTTTVRILAATLGSALVGLPYLLRDRLGTLGAWLSCLLLAISPGMVYFSRFAREDIYMAFFTLLLVVCTALYLRNRKPGWLVGAAIALSLSYATKEATFLTIAIFGSFFGALLAWELGVKWRAFQVRMLGKSSTFHTSAPFSLLIYWMILVPLALILLVVLKLLAFY